MEFKHNYKEFSAAAVAGRVKKMVSIREMIDAEQEHVRISMANRKTTALVPSVSLIPVADCGNCASCARGCYDVRNVCYLPSVQTSRAVNSAILRQDRRRYFREIADRVKFFSFFRWHVGGDIIDADYFANVARIAAETPRCEFLIFTKMFSVVNSWIDANGELPANLHVIFSDWRGQKMENPHRLPVSSPIWSDGTTGGAVTGRREMCPGDCSECAKISGGCWGAGRGDTILFEAH